ncbi:MAG: T9SS type A sorting domain-containing protein, partial [Bacteroidales bacterium]|nr:T9SS type A sorting domain-containing protein [Bacteroidales bacterium]
YIVGGFGEQDGPTWWNLDEPLELTPTDNPNEFTGTFPCGDDIEYKYICHPGNWEYQEAANLDPLEDHANRTYNEADVVEYWRAQPQVKLSVSLDEAYTGDTPSSLAVKGSWDEWGEPITLTKEGDAFVGAIGNGTDDVIYSNTQYKYVIPGETEADNNWEVRTDAEGNRWAIHPQMNDVIVNFEKEVVTGLNQINTEIALLQTSAGIVVQFNGQADIELYSINGQLIDKTRVSNTYRKDLNRGIYIIRVNGTSHKFVR